MKRVIVFGLRTLDLVCTIVLSAFFVFGYLAFGVLSMRPVLNPMAKVWISFYPLSFALGFVTLFVSSYIWWWGCFGVHDKISAVIEKMFAKPIPYTPRATTRFEP